MPARSSSVKSLSTYTTGWSVAEVQPRNASANSTARNFTAGEYNNSSDDNPNFLNSPMLVW